VQDSDVVRIVVLVQSDAVKLVGLTQVIRKVCDRVDVVVVVTVEQQARLHSVNSNPKVITGLVGVLQRVLLPLAVITVVAEQLHPSRAVVSEENVSVATRKRTHDVTVAHALTSPPVNALHKVVTVDGVRPSKGHERDTSPLPTLPTGCVEDVRELCVELPALVLTKRECVKLANHLVVLVVAERHQENLSVIQESLVHLGQELSAALIVPDAEVTELHDDADALSVEVIQALNSPRGVPVPVSCNADSHVHGYSVHDG